MLVKYMLMEYMPLKYLVIRECERSNYRKMYFEGSVQEAIALARSQACPVIILLVEDMNSILEGDIIETDICTSGNISGLEEGLLSWKSERREDGCKDAVLLRLQDRLNHDTDDERFKSARQFRAFCPIQVLPALIVIDNGKTILKMEGNSYQSKDVKRRLFEKIGGIATDDSKSFQKGNDNDGSIIHDERCKTHETDTANYGSVEPVGNTQAESFQNERSGVGNNEGTNQNSPNQTGRSGYVKISLKLPDGTKHLKTYSQDDILAKIFEDVDEVPNLGSKPYALTGGYPPRRFDIADVNRKLFDLGIEDRIGLTVVYDVNGHQKRLENEGNKSELEVLPSEKTREGSCIELNSGKQSLTSTCSLQLKLPNGSKLLADFNAYTQLAEIRKFVIENNLLASGDDFDLVNPFPRKIFLNSDDTQTLADLGLVPRSTLIIETLHGKNKFFDVRHSDMKHSIIIRVWELLRLIFITFLSFGYRLIQKGFTMMRSVLNVPDTEVIPHQSSENLRSNTASIHTMESDKKQSNDDDKRQRYWNGNSTVFDGDESKNHKNE